MKQLVTDNGSITTTTTYVAGGLEEIATNGVGTTLTKYFTGGNGLPTAERVGTNGPLSYLASDGQGTVSEALDGGGTVTFAQLYTPYGNARYSSGSSPTSIGYTGQRADGATGLDYYHARYYDPVAGQFASADTVNDGLNRYGYVGGNPATATDPTGHRCYNGDDSDCAPHLAPPPNIPVVKACPIGRPCVCPVTGCQPIPSPAPVVCQAPCTTPSHYQGCETKACVLRHDAQDAAEAFQSVEDRLTDFLSMLGGLMNFEHRDEIMDLVRRTLAGFDDLRKQFLAQAQWNDSRWTLENILAFERSTAFKAQLVGMLEWSLAGTLAVLPGVKAIPALARVVIGGFLAYNLPGFGDAVGNSVGSFIAGFYIAKEKADSYYNVDLGY